MFRKSRLDRFVSVSKNLRTARHAKYAHVAIEPLEDRKMLTASALINEIYFDPPSGGDIAYEYIELRGTPGLSLDNHYLIFLENENNALNTGNPGMVERIFNLNGQSIGSDGFLTLRQKGSPYTVAPGTTDLVNSGSGAGWGSGATSSINVVAENDALMIENSGFTAMLIVNNGGAPSAPFIGQDLDVGNDGLDVPTGNANWNVLDSIGVFSEVGEAEFGRLYAPINFGPDDVTSPSQVTGTYVNVGFEIEYVGRYGNSTGQTAADWHVSNLTDDPVAGFTGMADWRQSGPSHVPNSIPSESNHAVPVGTNLTKTLGAPNYPFGPSLDLNGLALDTGYSATWTGGGAVDITDPTAATIFQGDSANLVSLSATITSGANANNVLSANTAGTSISQSYNAGTGVLTLSGADTKANYQAVLRSIKYDNTGGGPARAPSRSTSSVTTVSALAPLSRAQLLSTFRQRPTLSAASCSTTARVRRLAMTITIWRSIRSTTMPSPPTRLPISGKTPAQPRSPMSPATPRGSTASWSISPVRTAQLRPPTSSSVWVTTTRPVCGPRPALPPASRCVPEPESVARIVSRSSGTAPRLRSGSGSRLSPWPTPTRAWLRRPVIRPVRVMRSSLATRREIPAQAIRGPTRWSILSTRPPSAPTTPW